MQRIESISDIIEVINIQSMAVIAFGWAPIFTQKWQEKLGFIITIHNQSGFSRIPQNELGSKILISQITIDDDIKINSPAVDN